MLPDFEISISELICREDLALVKLPQGDDVPMKPLLIVKRVKILALVIILTAILSDLFSMGICVILTSTAFSVLIDTNVKA